MKRVVIYDKTENNFVGWTWFFYALFLFLIGRIDDFHGAKDWEDALRWLISRCMGAKYDEVQFWGHGKPGELLIGKIALKPSSPETTKALLQDVAKVCLRSNSLFWARACSPFYGKSGKALAKFLAEALGCTVASYTRLVWIFQGSLFALKPGREPGWDDFDGGVNIKGWPWTPKTHTAFRWSFPLWARIDCGKENTRCKCKFCKPLN